MAYLKSLVLGAVWLAAICRVGAATGPTTWVGAAKLDITPDLPIRLSGYQGRADEANRAETRLHARALAIGGGDGAGATKPAVLITVELIGVGAETTEIVAAALAKSHGLERARVAICATHVHSGPALADVLPFMFSKDLPADETERIARYTAKLRTQLVAVAQAALADRKPGQLAWGEGTADVAAQRRVIVDGKWKAFGVDEKGPVDRALPVLRAADARGGIRAVLLNYACHCTTMEGKDNYLHGDWAGLAAQRLEEAHAGAVALVAIGCGADANPNPRGAPAVAGHGAKIAAEVERVLAGTLRPLGAVTTARRRELALPLDAAPTREALQARTGKGARVASAYAAEKHLATLAAGKPLATRVPYPVQTWEFGRDLAMVFLAGEVVAEYSLRLKRELGGRGLWVNAYANAVPCYIPSRRMYPEGGYEVDASMDYYGWPARLAEGTEDLIVGAVRTMVADEAKR